ncbi:uncharacterized protein [Haliotis asinina]|uniref:uncharacterized protein n=1 Tax=Haliotis asinina TaxID=109174 RepID=UPI0035326D1E
MKAFFILFVSACILVKVVSGFSKDDAKCQDTHSWCKTVNCDSPGIADSCPMTCGRCNSTVNCEGGQYWNGSTCTECWDGMPSEYRGKCPCANTGRWGVNCQHRCNKWCLDGICDPLSGECANCPRNRYSKMCDKTCDECGNCTEASPNCNRTGGTCLCGCSPGFYGRTCGEQCNNCRFKVCNSSGFCVHGCKEGYFGSQCDKECGECVDKSCSRMGECLNGCHSGWHGKECTSSCSSNCKDSNCHQNGTCMKCLDGFHGDQCQKNCSSGCAAKLCNRDGSCQCSKSYFGQQCRNTCNVNCRNTGCNQTSGECEYGCVFGWYGATCSTRCPDNCATGECSRYHGSCLSCRKGFRGAYCNTSCPRHCVECDQNASNCTSCESGYFGNTCEEKCNDCVNGSCNITDGFCMDGCKQRLYGRECQSNCSRNCIESTCDGSTGRCLNGCTHTMYGPYCNHTCSRNCKDSRCHTNGTDGSVPPCTLRCEDDMWGSCCDRMCPDCCTRCDRNIGSCEKHGSSRFVPWLVTIIVIIILLSVAVYAIRRNNHNNILKWRHIVGHSSSSPTPMSLINPSYQSTPRGAASPENSDYQELEPLTRADVEDDYITIRDSDVAFTHISASTHLISHRARCHDEELTPDLSPRPCHGMDSSNLLTVRSTEVMVQDLRFYVEHTKRSGGFTEQCYELPCGKLSPCDVAELPENVWKNRYSNILPYDHCRVKLSPIPNIRGSDYINASYINGYGETRTFVATQGPYGDVIPDFWRMLWEIDASKIIMLTNCVENRKAKCEKYWPDFGQPGSDYGDAHVQCVAEEELMDYTVRTFSVHREAELPRKLKQYHFTAWPDKAVPQDIGTLVDFHRMVKIAPSTGKGAAVVHCSAGVGRTGTWIALDYLIQQAKAEGVVDVFECIVRLRHQRMDLIQTEEQYLFLHEALMEALPTCDRMRRNLVDSGTGDYENVEKIREPAKNPLLDHRVEIHHGNDQLPEVPRLLLPSLVRLT